MSERVETSVSVRGVARKMGTGGRRDAVGSLNDALDCWLMRNAVRWGVRRGRAGMRFQIYPLVCWQCQRNVSSRRRAGVSQEQ
jgi:hypothetical protein